MAGDWAAARQEQEWKIGASAIFSSFASDVERTLYRHTIGVDLGPPRPPSTPASPADYASVIDQLTAYGFFNQGAVPPPCLLNASASLLRISAA